MADYPVLDGNGATIVATADGPADTYPIRGGDNAVLLAAERGPYDTYPIRDGNGNSIIAAPPVGGGMWWPVGSNFGWSVVPSRFMVSGRRVQQGYALAFARSSVAYAVSEAPNDNGWTAFAANVLRATNVGLTLEKAGTNLLLHSNDLTQAAWVKGTGVVPVISDDPAPVAGFWNDVNKGAVTSGNAMVYQNVDIVGGQAYVGVCFIRALSPADVGKLVDVECKRAPGFGATFAGFSTQVRLELWAKRVYVPFVSAADNTKAQITCRVSSSNAADNFQVSDFKIEAGVSATSPVPSGAAQGSRSADALSINLDATSDITVNFSEVGPNLTSNRMIYNGKLFLFDNDEDVDHAIRLTYTEIAAGLGGLRFEVRPGDEATVDTGTGKERAEASTKVNQTKGVDLWGAVALKVPTGTFGEYDYSAGTFTVLWQAKGNVEGRSPYLSIHLDGPDLVIDKRYWNGAAIVSTGEVARIAGFARDVYNNFVFYVKVGQTTGRLKVWYNGGVVYDFTGDVGYWDEANAGYSKVGIYRSAQTSTAVLYAQNVEELGAVDLTDRVANPLAIDAPSQVIQDAAPTGGVYVLNASAVNHSRVVSVFATPS